MGPGFDFELIVSARIHHPLAFNTKRVNFNKNERINLNHILWRTSQVATSVFYPNNKESGLFVPSLSNDEILVRSSPILLKLHQNERNLSSSASFSFSSWHMNSKVSKPLELSWIRGQKLTSKVPPKQGTHPPLPSYYQKVTSRTLQCVAQSNIPTLFYSPWEKN